MVHNHIYEMALPTLMGFHVVDLLAGWPVVESEDVKKLQEKLE
jgi:hypothetical protein